MRLCADERADVIHLLRTKRRINSRVSPKLRDALARFEQARAEQYAWANISESYGGSPIEDQGDG